VAAWSHIAEKLRRIEERLRRLERDVAVSSSTALAAEAAAAAPVVAVTDHGDLDNVTADQHHARRHAIDSTADHTGAITAAQHGTIASGNLHPEYLTPAEGDAAYQVTVEDTGVPLGVATTFDFVGAGVTATYAAGTATVTIPGGGGAGGDDLNPISWMGL
jgi:hypothetical protein